ncbi:MAG TPA: dienelactone hydrolase family protein [Xanthomonadaceae bacterium]
MRIATIVLSLLALAWCGGARAACEGMYPVGYRTLSLADGREVSVWYPATRASASTPHAGAPNRGEHADSPVATCAARWPLVLFSHGLAGCNEQAVFITEEIARHGYVVAAPNHRDAICGVVLERKFPGRPGSTRPPFLQPQRWTADAWRERMLDLRETLRLVQGDAALGRAIDPTRVALMGHSLGGYTVLGMAGGWPDWSLPGVRAVLAFSPYVLPYLAQHRLAQLRVPVMYQGGTYDFGITPNVVRPGGAYDASAAPKYLVELAGATHMAWTNLPCSDHRLVADCLAAVTNARLVDAYAIAFLDRHLKGEHAPLLDESGDGLAAYRHAASK